jgi:flagellar hook-associated protein 1 FlgK
MSLTIAFKTAQASILQAEKKLSVVSGNITNADVAGYTRKIYQSSYTTANGITMPTGGKIVQAQINTALARTLNQQTTSYAYKQAMSDYLSNYSDAYGGTGKAATNISNSLSSLTSQLQTLEENVGTTSSAQVIATSQSLAAQLNTLSQNIQDARRTASDDIATTIHEVNSNLQSLEKLNKQIGTATASGADYANLEDQRNVILQELSSQIGIQYSYNAQNQVTVYSSSGDLLLGSQAATLSYDAPGTITDNMSYPGTIGAITLNGKDITPSLKSGALGALVTLRDDTLPGEQEKLDELAVTLASTMNHITNQGTSVPARSSYTGNTAIDGTDPLGGSGTWRVAVLNADGKVQNTADLDLSSYATMDDLVTALNGIADVSATIDAQGKLQIASTASGSGIAFNMMDSDIDGLGATEFFGLNNLFDGDTTGTIKASTIKVNAALAADSIGFPTTTLSNSTTLAIGDLGASDGSGSLITQLVDALNAKQSFDPAGNFSAKSMTLGSFAAALIADAAQQASSATDAADLAATTFSYLSDKLSNETGVNIDEETANMTQIQASYEASAALISTIRDLFSTLINAVQ